MTKSIEYNGKVYTYKDIPKSFLKKYKKDPLLQYINAKKRQHKYYLDNKEALNERTREDYIKNNVPDSEVAVLLAGGVDSVTVNSAFTVEL